MGGTYSDMLLPPKLGNPGDRIDELIIELSDCYYIIDWECKLALKSF